MWSHKSNMLPERAHCSILVVQERCCFRRTDYSTRGHSVHECDLALSPRPIPVSVTACASVTALQSHKPHIYPASSRTHIWFLPLPLQVEEVNLFSRSWIIFRAVRLCFLSWGARSFRVEADGEFWRRWLYAFSLSSPWFGEPLLFHARTSRSVGFGVIQIERCGLRWVVSSPRRPLWGTERGAVSEPFMGA